MLLDCLCLSQEKKRKPATEICVHCCLSKTSVVNLFFGFWLVWRFPYRLIFVCQFGAHGSDTCIIQLFQSVISPSGPSPINTTTIMHLNNFLSNICYMMSLPLMLQQWVDLARFTGLQSRRSGPPPSYEIPDSPNHAALGCNNTEDATVDKIKNQWGENMTS